MRHHTKDKGDSGLGFVIASLMAAGIHVALPISEHLPFDCIAISNEGEMRRLSVKYSAARNGRISMRRYSTWQDRHGTHKTMHRLSDYDAFAVYCPDTKEVYYVPVTHIAGVTLSLRLVATRNNQDNRTPLAASYTDPALVFSPPPQRTEERVQRARAYTPKHPRKGERPPPKRVQWPEDAVLISKVESSGFCATGREYGASGNGVKKELGRRGLLSSIRRRFATGRRCAQPS